MDETDREIRYFDRVLQYIRALPWSDGIPDEVKTLVGGNILAYAGHIRAEVEAAEAERDAYKSDADEFARVLAFLGIEDSDTDCVSLIEAIIENRDQLAERADATQAELDRLRDFITDLGDACVSPLIFAADIFQRDYEDELINPRRKIQRQPVYLLKERWERMQRASTEISGIVLAALAPPTKEEPNE